MTSESECNTCPPPPPNSDLQSNFTNTKMHLDRNWTTKDHQYPGLSYFKHVQHGIHILECAVKIRTLFKSCHQTWYLPTLSRDRGFGNKNFTQKRVNRDFTQFAGKERKCLKLAWLTRKEQYQIALMYQNNMLQWSCFKVAHEFTRRV